MEGVARPLIAGGLFFAMARGYTMFKGADVSATAQLLVSGVLVASSAAAGLGEQQNPAVKALTTGSLFAGSMYVLGNDDVLTHGVLGTLCSYAAEVVAGSAEENVEEEVNEQRD